MPLSAVHFYATLCLISVAAELNPLTQENDDSLSFQLFEYTNYLSNFFAWQDTIESAKDWNKALPTEEEKAEMTKLVTYLYELPDFSTLNSSLIDDYALLRSTVEISMVEGYLVVHEKIPQEGQHFPRNWGLMALAEKTMAKRNLHHSAVHFESDGAVYPQAAYVCQHTMSRSLVLHGASRYAVKGRPKARCQKSYTISDGAHAANTMFHHWSTTLFRLSQEESGSSIFIQWHGMAESSCSKSPVFISAGTASTNIYNPALPACKIVATFNSLAPSTLSATTPKTDSTCKLSASTNVLGRFINGVPAEEVCSKKADEKQIKGQFVHIEQKAKARSALRLWSRTIQKAFPASATSSMST